ncbi:hypothetical protein Agub_g13638 [Astrephomene gubernaculifera]|uniref:Uncharacterized protein n=1 Tax=Astrephomene gubernaculifera TaxID=47775 RepID=A0AAD3E056_9CHLO|nr:hypothetical protein Agub_g13638 [Astrephomene gubernaculifera]
MCSLPDPPNSLPSVLYLPILSPLQCPNPECANAHPGPGGLIIQEKDWTLERGNVKGHYVTCKHCEDRPIPDVTGQDRRSCFFRTTTGTFATTVHDAAEHFASCVDPQDPALAWIRGAAPPSRPSSRGRSASRDRSTSRGRATSRARGTSAGGSSRSGSAKRQREGEPSEEESLIRLQEAQQKFRDMELQVKTASEEEATKRVAKTKATLDLKAATQKTAALTRQASKAEKELEAAKKAREKYDKIESIDMTAASEGEGEGEDEGEGVGEGECEEGEGRLEL